MISVKTAARRLRTEGVEEEIQARLDKACITPHVHPRWTGNDKPMKKRCRLRVSNHRWRTFSAGELRLTRNGL